MSAAPEGKIGRLDLDRLGQQVLGEVEMGWARHARLRGLEGGPHQAPRVLGLDEPVVPLGDLAHHPHHVELVPQVPVEPEGVEIGRHHEERHGVLLRRPHAEHRVGDAGADMEQAAADLSRDARVAVGHRRGAGLEARGDVFDLVLAVIDRVEDRQHGVARDAENVLDTLVDQGVDDRLRRGLGIRTSRHRLPCFDSLQAYRSHPLHATRGGR